MFRANAESRKRDNRQTESAIVSQKLLRFLTLMTLRTLKSLKPSVDCPRRSIYLLGFCLRYFFLYLVAPAQRCVGAVAIRLVGGHATTAQHVAIANLVTLPVLAFDAYSAANPQTAACSYGFVFYQSEARLVFVFVGLLAALVPSHQPSARTHRCLPNRQIASLRVFRCFGERPYAAVGVAETCEDAIFGVVRYRNVLAGRYFDIVEQCLRRRRRFGVPFVAVVRAVAIRLVTRCSAAAQCGRLAVGIEMTAFAELPTFASCVGYDELLRQWRSSENKIRTFFGNGYSEFRLRLRLPDFDFLFCHIINVVEIRSKIGNNYSQRMN